MTTHDLETDIDELSAELLGNLDPDDRVRLLLEARAVGRDDWVDRLRTTCPEDTYQTYDVDFTNRMRIARMRAQEALYALRVAIDRFRYTMLQRYLEKTLSVVASEEMAALAEDFAEAMDDGEKPIEHIADLARTYYGYKRFAEDILGVSLATWVGALADGEAVVEAAEELLQLYESNLDIGADGDGTEVLEVSAAAEEVYDMLTAEWERLDDPLFFADL